MSDVRICQATNSVCATCKPSEECALFAGTHTHLERVDHPAHYNAHPSGIECIDVVEHMGFNLGNAIKYIWRADHKGASIEDLKKARWYVDREIQKRENGK
ncbi:DUF3310 domain-containing protein [Paraburkholderia sp. 2C]